MGNMQTLVSLCMLAVAILCALYTRRMLHASRDSYLRPIELRTRGSECTVRVRNYGPALAVRVKVKGTKRRRGEADPTNLDRYWMHTSLEDATGPSELSPNQAEDFSFGSIFNVHLKLPFLVQWRTMTGKTQTTFWRNEPDAPDQFEPLSFREVLRYKAWWGALCLVSPFRKIQKWHCFRRASKQ